MWPRKNLPTFWNFYRSITTGKRPGLWSNYWTAFYRTITWPADSDLLFRIVTAPAHFQERLDNMHSYHWRNVCDKLITLDPPKAMPLLDVLLQQMGNNYRLSYDHYVEPMMTNLCRIDPSKPGTL